MVRRGRGGVGLMEGCGVGDDQAGAVAGVGAGLRLAHRAGWCDEEMWPAGAPQTALGDLSLWGVATGDGPWPPKGDPRRDLDLKMCLDVFLAEGGGGPVVTG